MDNRFRKIFEEEGLNFSRLLGSKFRYRKSNPENLVVFNSRIYLKSVYEKQKSKKIRDFFKGQEDEIWYGDIDFNIDIYKLYKAQRRIGESIVITSEMGNKIIEIGDIDKNVWVGYSRFGKKIKGITLRDIRKKK